jgi:hypothetical protein
VQFNGSAGSRGMATSTIYAALRKLICPKAAY